MGFLCFLSLSLSVSLNHNQHISAHPDGLTQYVTSGPMVAMVWEGKSAVKNGRTLVGATNPAESAPGTFRRRLRFFFVLPSSFLLLLLVLFIIFLLFLFLSIFPLSYG